MQLLCVNSNDNVTRNEEAVARYIRAATAGISQRPWELWWLLSWTEVGLPQLAYVCCVLIVWYFKSHIISVNTL